MSVQGRVLELDAFRGLAVLGVILFHYTSKYHEEYIFENPGFLFEHGHLGVQLFFIISGYVIFMTVDKVNSTGQFIWKRFTRLYPVYWASIILTYTLVALIGLEGREVSWKAFLFNFSMLQDLFQIPNVDGAYWSLLPELMFYLTMVILIMLKLKKYVSIFSILWIAIIIAYKFIEFPVIAEQMLNLKYGMLFIAGIHFYLLKNEIASSKTKIIFYVFNIILSLVAVFIVFEEQIAHILISVFYLLFTLQHFNALKFLKFKPLVFIGTISYPLYLTHQNIGYMFMNVIELNFWLELLISLFLAILIGSFLHFIVEKPAISKLRKIAAKVK